MIYQTRADIQVAAFRVAHVAFTGEAFDGPPFEGRIDEEDHWLQAAIMAGDVALVPDRTVTHAVWAVKAGAGEVVLASPGDYILRLPACEYLQVCSSALLGTLLTPQEVHLGHVQVPPVPAEVQEGGVVKGSSVPVHDQDGQVVGSAHVGEVFNLSEALSTTVIDDAGNTTTYPGPSNAWEAGMDRWCDRVHQHMVALKPDVLAPWSELMQEVHDLLGDKEATKLPLAWLKTYFIVGIMERQILLLQPGHSELEALQGAKLVAQQAVEQELEKDRQKEQSNGDVSREGTDASDR